MLSRILRRAGSAARGRALLAGAGVVVAALAILVLLESGGASRTDISTSHLVRYDESEGVNAAEVDLGERPIPLALNFFTDCVGGAVEASGCGGEPARWVAPRNPLDFCTSQESRPASLGAEDFRAMVARSIATWNAQEAATGIRYTGDCALPPIWVFGNERNEIGWDDARDALSGQEAGITRGRWRILGGSKDFREADIILEGSLLATRPRQCIESVIAHEVGHALGLGHSNSRADLMYPSFDPSDIRTCKLVPTEAERTQLQTLYGIDRSPTVSVGPGGSVEAGASVVVTAIAIDPEGDPLTYEWTQVGGPRVELVGLGATARFAAPTTPGAEVRFRVSALDRYHHAGTTEVTYTVIEPGAPLTVAPSLESFAPGTSDAVLGWSAVPGAGRYELCTASPGGAPECSVVGGPSAGVTWDTRIEGVPAAGDYRVLTSGERAVTLRACNAQGCTTEGDGGLAGGVRWASAAVDYDYFVLAYDAAGVQFTIVGVVNVSGEPRSFTLGMGPLGESDAVRLQACGRLAPGQSCIGFAGPGQRHYEVVSILAEASGRPTLEHWVRAR